MKKYDLHYSVLVDDKKLFNSLIAKSPELIMEKDIRDYTVLDIAIEEDKVIFLKNAQFF